MVSMVTVADYTYRLWKKKAVFVISTADVFEATVCKVQCNVPKSPGKYLRMLEMQCIKKEVKIHLKL